MENLDQNGNQELGQEDLNNYDIAAHESSYLYDMDQIPVLQSEIESFEQRVREAQISYDQGQNLLQQQIAELNSWPARW